MTATANEPAPEIGPAESALIENAVDHGRASLTAFVGSATSKPFFTQDVSVYYDRETREVDTDAARLKHGFESNISAVQKKLDGAANVQSQLDVLGLLGVMARTPGPAVLLVHTSGLQTTGLLDLRGQGSDLDVAATVTRLRQQQDQLPDLTGKQVIFVGLGDVSGPQRGLTERMRHGVEDLWRAVCELAHGECGHPMLPSVGGQPHSRTPVPTVPVPAVASVVVMRGNPRTDRIITLSLPTGLYFMPNGADYLPGAESKLVEVVALLADPDWTVQRVTVVGHCATYGPRGGAVALSRTRAQRVADSLARAARIDRSRFAIRGIGFDHPLVADLDARGHLVPEAAEQNRTVVLTVERQRSEGHR